MRLLLLLVAAASFLALPNGTAAASIGIDFGSEKLTVALARSSARDVAVVPNRLGYRSSPTLVGFAVRPGQLPPLLMDG
jgi:molecular chaperone DnaK (HSP70)